MCNPTVITTGPCRCGSSSGLGPGDALVVVGFAAGVGLAYSLFRALGPGLVLVLYAAAWLGVLTLGSKRLRPHLWRGLRWLLREMWRTWSRRHERPATTSTALAVPQPWHAVLTAATHAGTQELAAGTVVGTWASAAECESDVVDQARRAYAGRGEAPPGLLSCRAERETG